MEKEVHSESVGSTGEALEGKDLYRTLAIMSAIIFHGINEDCPTETAVTLAVERAVDLMVRIERYFDCET